MRIRGFTLIEILVVIAIIAILAAILFPVFTHAKSKAREAVCASNLKQIAMALRCYATDYDGGFPLDSNWGPGCFWYERIEPYVKSMSIGVCPSKGLVERSVAGASHPYEWTYALNACMCRMDMYGGNTLYDLSRIQIDYDSASMLLVGEAVTDVAPPDWFYPAWWQYNQYHEFLHNGRANVAFVDGHVKNLGPSARFSQYPGVLLH